MTHPAFRRQPLKNSSMIHLAAHLTIDRDFRPCEADFG
jgi:hypothetical protein